MPYVAVKSATLVNGLDRQEQDVATGGYLGKRFFDLVLVIASLPFLLPVILVLAALVALKGGKPFYLQDRVGRDGRVFRMVKLRTMVPNAEARLQEHLKGNAAARLEWDRFQKLSDDPRVTWLGRFLRRSSFDELPQLFNVLTGDMSLVGPRPIMPDQAELYPGTAYVCLRPGITGPWQVSGRNAVSFAERAGYDRYYLARQSLLTDIGYLVLTVVAVFKLSGR